MNLTLIVNVLSDSSETFDLWITDDNGSSVEISLCVRDERDANKQVNKIHQALEAATISHIPWNDTIRRQK